MRSKTRRPKLLTSSSLRTLRAFARVELSMSSWEFDQLTPADWVLLFRQWKLRELREDLRIARICQIIAATRGVKSSLRDHLPDPPEIPKIPKGKRKKFQQTPPKQIERQLLSLFPKANLKPQWRKTQ